jgi:membrane protease YdiL (CAAX protease family)
MPVLPDQSSHPTLARECGLQRPGPGWWAWLRDTHATLANVLVTVGFVALHLRSQPLAWALAVAAPSLVLGHLRERFGSVWPAMLVHVIYNAGFGLTAWLFAMPLPG